MAKKEKEKKPFNETGFGKFVKKVGEHAGVIIDVAAEVATGDIGGAIEVVRDKISESKLNEMEKQKLLVEIESQRMTWMKELYELEVRDRESARNRETALAQSGHRDWFQYFVGFTGMVVFAYLVWFLTHETVPFDNREIFIHLVGIVEGVIISIFGYYFGSSLGSKYKDIRNNG